MVIERRERVEGGLLGLLIGDALGVPYEFHAAKEIPEMSRIEMTPPADFPFNRAAPFGTWSDDGAEALCLLASLLDCGGLDLDDFGQRLVSWLNGGYMAVDSRPYDVGSQTSEALTLYKAGVPAEESGLKGERNNGNGSLMRVLPLALLWEGSDESLVRAAHRQSVITHAHPRSQVCCALYSLWARRELDASPDAWGGAVVALRGIYKSTPFLRELDEHVRPEEEPEARGAGYVVSTLLSARIACREADYESIVRRAVSFGGDTDTTACLAGGIAGLRHGFSGIPDRWWKALRGKNIVVPLIARMNAGK